MAEIISGQLTGNVRFGYGFCEWFDLGVDLPIVLYQTGDGFAGQDAPGSFGIGDLRLVPRIKLYSNQSWFDLALMPEIGVPTGHLVDAYMGSPNFSFLPRLSENYVRFLLGVRHQHVGVPASVDSRILDRILKLLQSGNLTLERIDFHRKLQALLLGRFQDIGHLLHECVDLVL